MTDTTLLTTETPVAHSVSTAAWELGIRFSSDVGGHLTAIRFWKQAGENGPHVGHVWSATGQLLGSCAFVDETASGWQQQSLLSPVAISPTAEYVVSVNAGSGFHFPLTANACSAPIVNGPLHTVASAGRSGLSGTAPSVVGPHNYFRDVVFEADVVAPVSVITIESPVGGEAVSGTVAIEATITHRVGVQFAADGEDAGARETSSHYSGEWESAGAAEGDHVLTATGQDAAGHAIHASVTVNTLAPPLPPVVVPQALIAKDDLVYEGAIRVSKANPIGGSSFSYGGYALEFDPVTRTFLIVGHIYQQMVAEMTVPDPIIAADREALPTATVIRGFADVLQERLGSPDSASANPHRGEARQGQPTSAQIGGLLAWQGKLVVSTFLYYDGDGTSAISHYITNRDLSGKTIIGPLRTDYGPGLTAGYFARVPKALQATLGGEVVCGQSSLSIVSRSSCGPALFAIDPSKLGFVNPLPVQPLVFYGTDHMLDNNKNPSSLYNLASRPIGCVIPEGRRSVLFFGRHGLGTYLYGEAADCGDPAITSKGGHAFPYAYYVWAYDADELADVRAGKRKPWEVSPYAVWSLDLPFAAPNTEFYGATYDAVTGRIFLSASQQWQPQGEALPLIHVFTVKGLTP